MSNISSLLDSSPRLELVWKYVESHMEKELLGHLRFVLIVADHIAQWYPDCHRDCILTAALIHDIGRPFSSETLPHEIVGSQMVYDILPSFGYMKDEVDIVSGCVLRHNGKLGFATIEQEIVCNADAASKVLYHEAFMLLCKKEDYREKVLWCRKYLNKWWNLLTLDSVRDLSREKYEHLSEIYRAILE